MIWILAIVGTCSNWKADLCLNCLKQVILYLWKEGIAYTQNKGRCSLKTRVGAHLPHGLHKKHRLVHIVFSSSIMSVRIWLCIGIGAFGEVHQANTELYVNCTLALAQHSCQSLGFADMTQPSSFEGFITLTYCCFLLFVRSCLTVERFCKALNLFLFAYMSMCECHACCIAYNGKHMLSNPGTQRACLYIVYIYLSVCILLLYYNIHSPLTSVSAWRMN